MNNILVLGSGGREHSMVWSLSNDQNVKNIFFCCYIIYSKKKFKMRNLLVNMILVHYNKLKHL